MAIFNFIGSIFGYLLWFLYQIFRNYGVAIIFFTLITKLIMIPFSIKQQKSMAAQTKMAAKQRELQQKYAGDREKMNRELQRLYEKENFNPMGGCATSLLPFPIMIGIYYSVIYPLQNTLHIAASTISQATEVFAKIPGVSITGNYMELEILRHFPALKDYFLSHQIFTADEAARIESFNQGFRFLGLDLLATPKGSPWTSMLWLIPVLCLVSYWGMQWLTTKISGNAQAQQGCMKVMFFVLPLFSAYWAYVMPAAVGLYWVVSSLLQMVQSYVLYKMYSPAKVAAHNEAAHVALMDIEEKKIRPLPQEVQDKIAEKLLPRKEEPTVSKSEKQQSAAENKPSAPKKKKSGKGGNSSDYMGSKK